MFDALKARVIKKICHEVAGVIVAYVKTEIQDVDPIPTMFPATEAKQKQETLGGLLFDAVQKGMS